MKTTSNAARVEHHEAHVEPTRASTHVLDLRSIKKARRSRKIDAWFIAILIVAVSLFAGTFAMYTLVPAMRTLATSAQH